MFYEALVCIDAGLGETVHPLVDLDKDMAVVDQWEELVLLHDARGDILNGNPCP
jgi:hypothetical protein